MVVGSTTHGGSFMWAGKGDLTGRNTVVGFGPWTCGNGCVAGLVRSFRCAILCFLFLFSFFFLRRSGVRWSQAQEVAGAVRACKSWFRVWKRKR